MGGGRIRSSRNSTYLPKLTSPLLLWSRGFDGIPYPIDLPFIDIITANT